MTSQNKNFKLTIKNVRCFAGEQHFDIRPLTFLIGANSTGKTTIMSCFSTIYNLILDKGLRHPDFNTEPYSMGTFIDIVTRPKTGVRNKNSQIFEIGIAYNNEIKHNFYFKGKKSGTEPIIKKASSSFKDISFSCEAKKEGFQFSIKDNNRVIKKTIPPSALKVFESKPFTLEGDVSPVWFLGLIGAPALFKIFSLKDDTFSIELEKLYNRTQKIFVKNLFNMAPVRSKPKRTYDPIKEFSSSEGSEVPVFLSNLKRKPADWKKMHKDLIAFGKNSGLFSNIEISKKLGNTTAGPFQLQFKIRGIESNMIDTGYGLSQILPLLVRLFASNIQAGKSSKNKETWFLLQQPEIHLHPEAQAELASLFAKSVKTNNSFLIETHSDYILDRTRIEVRNKKIAPDQVSIIYLEPIKEGVKAHNISIDKNGNLKGVPKGYRKFFDKETDRLLGFKD